MSQGKHGTENSNPTVQGSKIHEDSTEVERKGDACLGVGGVAIFGA